MKRARHSKASSSALDASGSPSLQGKHIRSLPNDPLALDAISQAAYVLNCFEKGLTAKELTDLLEDEKSLADAYILFFGQVALN